MLSLFLLILFLNNYFAALRGMTEFGWERDILAKCLVFADGFFSCGSTVDLCVCVNLYIHTCISYLHMYCNNAHEEIVRKNTFKFIEEMLLFQLYSFFLFFFFPSLLVDAHPDRCLLISRGVFTYMHTHTHTQKSPSVRKARKAEERKRNRSCECPTVKSSCSSFAFHHGHRHSPRLCPFYLLVSF